MKISKRLAFLPLTFLLTYQTVWSEVPVEPGDAPPGENADGQPDDEYADGYDFGVPPGVPQGIPPGEIPPPQIPPPPVPPPAGGFDAQAAQAQEEAQEGARIEPPRNSPVEPPPRATPAPRPPILGSRRNSTPQIQKSTVKPTVIAPLKGPKNSKLADYLQLDSAVRGLQVKNFDLPDKEIRDVVTLISKWTGKNFILDNKVRGKITILGPSQVTLEEAYQAFLSALEANSLTTVQSGKFIRIIESAEARRAPVETYSGEFAPDTDQFITRIKQLKYINADEVQREFRDLTTRQGKLFAYEPTNSIIVTDTGSNIRRIEGILTVLDIPGFETKLHVLPIKHTSSKAIAQMLDEIYADGKGGGSQNRSRSFRRTELERTRGGGIISKIIPDEQTNSLVVLANQAGFIQLKQLVSKLDVKAADTGKIHVYYCEYAKAEDLASTLASLAGSGGGGGGSSKKQSALNSSGSPTPSTPGGASSSRNKTVSSSGPISADFGDGVKITSDSATNSLVITASAGDFKTLKRVIRKLDIPRLQVFVESAIMEINMDRSTNFGINYGASESGRLFAGGFIGDSSTLAGLITNGLPSAGLTAPFAIGHSFTNSYIDATGATKTATSFPFLGLVSLLAKNTNSSILSTPQIIALDNEEATFKVQDEIPVQSTFVTAIGTANAGIGAGQGSIEYKKVGIEIKLTPHVNAVSKQIRLEIEQKIDSIKNTGVPDGLSKVQIATTSRETNTNVVVKNEEFVMLGGLMSDRVQEQVIKVPLLGDIPILGWLFKSKIFQSSKTNLVILLRPHIIGTSMASAQKINEALDKRKNFIDKHMSGDDPNGDDTTEIRRKVDEQTKRAGEDPLDRYKNNEKEDQEETEPTLNPSAEG